MPLAGTLPSRSPLWFRQLGVAAIYGWLVWVVLVYITPSGKGSILFLASGFALAAVLAGGRRYVWGILLGAVTVNLWFGYAPQTALLKSFGSTLGALLGAWLVTRGGNFDRTLPTLQDYLRLLVLGGWAAGALSAAIGTTALIRGGVIAPADYGDGFLSWWLGDTLGVVLVAAPCLLWMQPGADGHRSRWYEIAPIAALVFLAGQMVFLAWFDDGLGSAARGYWMFFFVFLAAVRLTPRWTSLLLVMIAVQATLGAYRGVGYFAADQVPGLTLNFWLYTTILSLIGMTLSIYLTQRRRTEEVLRQRSEELSLYNRTLQKIHEGATLTHLLNDLAAEVERILPQVRCSILLMDRDGAHLRHGAAPSLPDFYNQAVDGLAIGEGMGACGTAARRRECVVIPDLAQDALWPSQLVDAARRAGVQACWSQPVLDARQKVVGTFALYHPQPAQPARAEIELLERMSGLAALAIEQTQVQTDLRLKDAVLDASADPTMITDRSSHIVWINRAFGDLTGYAPDEAIGRRATDIVKSDKLRPRVIRGLWKGVLAGEAWRGELINRTKDGTEFHQDTLVTPVRSAAGDVTHFFVIVRDISERKRAEENIRALAFHDDLTQLPNRRLLDDRLTQAIAAGRRSGRCGALMFLDLDNFKPLNDVHGHSVGDLLLVEVARRLTRCVRATDTVARFGGDEFVVLSEGLEADRQTAAEQAGAVAEKIREALAEPYVLTVAEEGRALLRIEHRCTTSVGVALFTAADAPDDVLQWADLAMYRAKVAGRNGVAFYAAS